MMKKYHVFGSEEKLKELASALKGKGIHVEKEKEDTRFYSNETPKLSFQLTKKQASGIKIFKKLNLRPICSEI